MPKDYNEFLETLNAVAPDSTWPEALKSLWFDAKGNWHRAHEIVDGNNDLNAQWIHAYLHRKEGDDWNARYWYRRAGKDFPSSTLEEEHRALVAFIIK